MMDPNWKNCKNILCIRPDNMGDLLMSSPAILAIKQSIGCKITVLTSSMAKSIAQFIPGIDDAIIFDMPWVKKERQVDTSDNFQQIIADIRERQFDAAIIFTVYSQNPLPSAMIAYLAGIPLRLSYCRENPYDLLTHWLPDKEPYSFVQHQVKRDIALVKSIGAACTEETLQFSLPNNEWETTTEKLINKGINVKKKLIVLHAGVSEPKREYSKEYWIVLAKKIASEIDCQILFTGSVGESVLTGYFAEQTGQNSFSLGGVLSLAEFLLLIKNAALVISVNTLTIHAAAATKTPVIALYAFTNPQHFPWRAKGKVFLYNVPLEQQSKNEIIQYANKLFKPILQHSIPPLEIADTACDILINKKLSVIPEMPELNAIMLSAELS